MVSVFSRLPQTYDSAMKGGAFRKVVYLRLQETGYRNHDVLEVASESSRISPLRVSRGRNPETALGILVPPCTCVGIGAGTLGEASQKAHGRDCIGI
jgi:hypothetical protein